MLVETGMTYFSKIYGNRPENYKNFCKEKNRYKKVYLRVMF
jgi:hypothetical protein